MDLIVSVPEFTYYFPNFREVGVHIALGLSICAFTSHALFCAQPNF